MIKLSVVIIHRAGRWVSLLAHLTASAASERGEERTRGGCAHKRDHAAAGLLAPRDQTLLLPVRTGFMCVRSRTHTPRVPDINALRAYPTATHKNPASHRCGRFYPVKSRVRARTADADTRPVSLISASLLFLLHTCPFVKAKLFIFLALVPASFPGLRRAYLSSLSLTELSRQKRARASLSFIFLAHDENECPPLLGADGSVIIKADLPPSPHDIAGCSREK